MASLPQVGLEAVIAGMPGFNAGAAAIVSAYDSIEKKSSNVQKATSIMGSAFSSITSPIGALANQFVGLGQNVLQFGAIAGGAALVGVTALTAGVVALGGAALQETAKYERMSLSIQNLVAREISQGQVVEQQKQILAGLTKKETEELEKLSAGLDNEINDRDVLSARIQEQKERIRQLTDQYGEQGLVVIKERAELQGMELDLADLNNEINTHQGRITDLTSKEGQLITTMEKVRTGQMSMTDAMTQAGPRAQELLKWIQLLAIQSPFTQEGIANAFRTTLAYGFTTEEAQRLTTAMVDFTSATGKSEQSAELIALALGQIQARGKLSAQELRQLSEQGVGTNAILERMGYSLDDVTNGLVGTDEFIEAVIADMEVFKGAAKEQSTTLAGLMSSLSDLKSIALREFFTSTFSAIRPYVAEFVDWLTEAAVQTGGIKKLGEALGQSVGGAIKEISQFIAVLGTGGLSAFNYYLGAEGIPLWYELQDLIKNISGIFSGLGSLISSNLAGPFSEFTTNIIPMLTKGLAFINEHFEEFKGSLIGIGAVLGVGVFAALVAGILTLLTPINLIIAGAALLGAAWAGNWGNIQGITFQAIDIIQQKFGEFSTFWQTNWPMIQAVLLTAWTVIQSVFNGIVQGINASLGPAITQIGAAFTKLGIDWGDVGNALLTATQIVFAGIGAIILAAISVVTGLVGGIVAAVGTMVQYWGYLMTIVSQTVAGIMTVVTSLQVFWQAIFAGDLPLALQAAGTGIAGLLIVVTGIVAGIVTAVTGMVSTVISLFSGLITSITGFWQGLFNTLVGHSIIPDMVKRIVEVLTGEDWFEIGASMIKGILEGIQKNQAKVWEILKDMAKKALEEAGKAIGFGSPAKKFVPLGESIIQGLMVGVDAQSPAFKDRLNKTLQSAIDLTGGLVKSGMAGGAVRQMVRNVFKTVMTNTDQLGKITGQGLADMVRTQLSQFGYNIPYVEKIMRDLGYNYEKMAEQLNQAHSDLMRELRLEAAGESLGKAGQFLSFGQLAADRLQSRVDTLQGLVEAGGGEYLGTIYSALEAQNMLNAALAEQASVQQEINALAQQQADLQFLQQQVSILKMVQDAGLDAGQIFQGITFGLDASLPDLIAATSNVVQAMINQVNEDLQIGSPSKIMTEKFKQVGAGMIEGLMSTVPLVQKATGFITDKIINVPAGQVNGGTTNNNSVQYNFNNNFNQVQSTQGVMQQFQIMRSMVA